MERRRLTQKAEGDAKEESTAQSITSALSTNYANNESSTPPKTDRLAVSLVETPYVDKTKWVIKLSSRSLSDVEEKGINFAVTPTNIPATEIIAKVERAVRQLDAEQPDNVRRAANGILQQAEAPEPNITKEMRNALKA